MQLHGDSRGTRMGSAGDSRGTRMRFGGLARKRHAFGLGFGGTRLRPLSPFIILKGVRSVLLRPKSRSQHSRILRGARLSRPLYLSLCVSMWSSPTPSRLLRSAGRLSLPLYLSLSLCLEFYEAPVGSLTLSTSLCVSLCGAVRRRLEFYGAPVGSLQPAKPTTPTVWSTYRPTDDPTDPPTASNRSDDRPSDQPIDRRPSERPTDRNRLSDTPVSLLF